MLEKDSNILVIGESSTGMGAIELVHELQPDVLLLDIEMPDMKGYHVATALRAGEIQVSILARSDGDDGHFMQEVLQMGMGGFLPKRVFLKDSLGYGLHGFHGKTVIK